MRNSKVNKLTSRRVYLNNFCFYNFKLTYYFTALKQKHI